MQRFYDMRHLYKSSDRLKLVLKNTAVGLLSAFALQQEGSGSVYGWMRPSCSLKTYSFLLLALNCP